MTSDSPGFLLARHALHHRVLRSAKIERERRLHFLRQEISKFAFFLSFRRFERRDRDEDGSGTGATTSTADAASSNAARSPHLRPFLDDPPNSRFAQRPRRLPVPVSRSHSDDSTAGALDPLRSCSDSRFDLLRSRIRDAGPRSTPAVEASHHHRCQTASSDSSSSKAASLHFLHFILAADLSPSTSRRRFPFTRCTRYCSPKTSRSPSPSAVAQSARCQFDRYDESSPRQLFLHSRPLWILEHPRRDRIEILRRSTGESGGHVRSRIFGIERWSGEGTDWGFETCCDESCSLWERGGAKEASCCWNDWTADWIRVRCSLLLPRYI